MQSFLGIFILAVGSAVPDRMCDFAGVATLTSLNLSGCGSWITDAHLARIKGLPLQDLDLSYSGRQITNGGIHHMAAMPLTTLNLIGCTKIDDRAMSALKQMPLVTLYLTAEQFSLGAVERLLLAVPSIKELRHRYKYES